MLLVGPCFWPEGKSPLPLTRSDRHTLRVWSPCQRPFPVRCQELDNRKSCWLDRQLRASKLSLRQDVLDVQFPPDCSHHCLEASYPRSLSPYFCHQGLSPRHQRCDCNHIGRQSRIGNRVKPLLRARCPFLGSFNTREMHQSRCLPHTGIHFPIGDGSDSLLDAPTGDMEPTHDSEAQIPTDICLGAGWLVYSPPDDCFATLGQESRELMQGIAHASPVCCRSSPHPVSTSTT